MRQRKPPVSNGSGTKFDVYVWRGSTAVTGDPRGSCRSTSVPAGNRPPFDHPSMKKVASNVPRVVANTYVQDYRNQTKCEEALAGPQKMPPVSIVDSEGWWSGPEPIRKPAPSNGHTQGHSDCTEILGIKVCTDDWVGPKSMLETKKMPEGDWVVISMGTTRSGAPFYDVRGADIVNSVAFREKQGKVHGRFKTKEEATRRKAELYAALEVTPTRISNVKPITVKPPAMTKPHIDNSLLLLGGLVLGAFLL